MVPPVKLTEIVPPGVTDVGLMLTVAPDWPTVTVADCVAVPPFPVQARV